MWSNIILLTLCWALSWLVDAILITASVLAAKDIGIADGLATFSIALEFVGISIASIPATFMMHAWGRKIAFANGAVLGMIGGLFGVFAMYTQDFLCFCASAFFCGLSLGYAQFYRFAAVEVADDKTRPIAVSLVVSGGVLAAGVGPEIAIYAKSIDFSFLDEVPDYVGVYAAMVVANSMALVCILFLRLPELSRQKIWFSSHSTDSSLFERASLREEPAISSRELSGIQESVEDEELFPDASSQLLLPVSSAIIPHSKVKARGLLQIFLQPGCLMAVLASMVSMAIMLFLMAPTPIAMSRYGYNYNESCKVIQGHLVAMFLPGLFSGHVAARIGTMWVIHLGSMFFAAALVVLWLAHDFWNFLVGLALLGVGWNFSFTGATTQLTSYHNEQETLKTQMVNDIIVFGGSASGPFLAGFVYHHLGWPVTLLVAAALGAALLLITIPLHIYNSLADIS